MIITQPKLLTLLPNNTMSPLIRKFHAKNKNGKQIDDGPNEIMHLTYLKDLMDLALA